MKWLMFILEIICFIRLFYIYNKYSKISKLAFIGVILFYALFKFI